MSMLLYTGSRSLSHIMRSTHSDVSRMTMGGMLFPAPRTVPASSCMTERKI